MGLRSRRRLVPRLFVRQAIETVDRSDTRCWLDTDRQQPHSQAGHPKAKAERFELTMRVLTCTNIVIFL